MGREDRTTTRTSEDPSGETSPRRIDGCDEGSAVFGRTLSYVMYITANVWGDARTIRPGGTNERARHLGSATRRQHSEQNPGAGHRYRRVASGPAPGRTSSLPASRPEYRNHPGVAEI